MPARGRTRETDRPTDVGPRPSQFERMVFFSDAVFAISITLLAIDLRLPETAARVTGSALDRALVDLAPKVFSYAMSFAVIGLYWLAHWRRFAVVRSTNERLTTINLVLLGFIGLIPFPTSLLGDHGDQPSVVILYALVMAGAGIAGTWSWLYANRAGLAPHGRSARWVRTVAMRGLIIPAVFLGSLPLLLVGTALVNLAWLLVFPAQAWVLRLMRTEEGASQA